MLFLIPHVLRTFLAFENQVLSFALFHILTEKKALRWDGLDLPNWRTIPFSLSWTLVRLA
jgi:hypothetical protein